MIKHVDLLSTDLFSDEISYVSIGRIRKDIINSILGKYPEFTDILSPDKEILFWRDRVKHTERHRKDFSSEEEYEFCFERIPWIIRHPDYISIHHKQRQYFIYLQIYG